MHIDRNCGINYKLGLTLGVRSCEGIGMSQKITPCGSVGNVVGGKREKKELSPSLKIKGLALSFFFVRSLKK